MNEMNEALILAIQFEVWFLIGSALILIVYKMFTGRINLRGLINDKETKNLSPGRIQLLILTLVGAVTFLIKVAEVRVSTPGCLPEVPEDLIALLGGSNALYLVGKGRTMVRGLLRE